jgi:hypothetical protein
VGTDYRSPIYRYNSAHHPLLYVTYCSRKLCAILLYPSHQSIYSGTLIKKLGNIFRKGFVIYEEMREYLVIYKKAPDVAPDPFQILIFLTVHVASYILLHPEQSIHNLEFLHYNIMYLPPLFCCLVIGFIAYVFIS